MKCDTKRGWCVCGEHHDDKNPPANPKKLYDARPQDPPPPAKTPEPKKVKPILPDPIPVSKEAEPSVFPEKNPDAVALGRLGGRKGGLARAAKLSPERRSAIARKASRVRWKYPFGAPRIG